MLASQALVHYSRGSDSDVVFGFTMNTSMGKVLQVVPTSESVCWSPSGVIFFTRQGHKDQGGRGSKRSR